MKKHLFAVLLLALALAGAGCSTATEGRNAPPPKPVTTDIEHPQNLSSPDIRPGTTAQSGY